MANFKSTRFHAPKFMPGDGCGMVLSDTVRFAAAPAVNDTYDFKIPAGMEVTDVQFQSDDMDTNGTPTIAFQAGYVPSEQDSGYTAALTYFAPAGQAIARAGGRLSCAFKPIKFEEDVILRVTVTTAAATFAAGDLIAIVTGAARGVK